MAEIQNNAVVVDQAPPPLPPPAVEARRGRQRVEMKRMKNEKNLQVTFSKRRNGLFKKASELCTLCGAEMALIVFSPSAKVYSFGSPSVDAVLDRYLSYAAAGDGSGVSATAAVDELHARLAELKSEVEAERKKGTALGQQRREAVAAGRWWEAPLETIQDEAQLIQLAEALENLKSGVKLQNDRILAETTATIASLSGPIYGNGGGGGGEFGGGQAVPSFTDYMINLYNNYNNGVAYPFDDNGFF